jgi:hypothetical protein
MFSTYSSEECKTISSFLAKRKEYTLSYHMPNIPKKKNSKDDVRPIRNKPKMEIVFSFSLSMCYEEMELIILLK